MLPAFSGKHAMGVDNLLIGSISQGGFMKNRMVVSYLSALAGAMILLAACGGGGGGGTTAPAAAVGGAVGGVAAKGILANAIVTAYCGNSEAPADQLALRCCRSRPSLWRSRVCPWPRHLQRLRPQPPPAQLCLRPRRLRKPPEGSWRQPARSN